jgi:hypothetical protein
LGYREGHGFFYFSRLFESPSSYSPNVSLEMSIFVEICRWVSILAFLGYGTACLLSNALIAEFERYGLPRLRRLVGAFELAGALGLIIGYRVPILGVYASAGLCLLMAFGILTRIRIRDSFLLTLPAITLMLMNGVLFLQLWGAAARMGAPR